MTDQEDTYGGIFWVRATDSYWQTATPGEACAEIKRVRAENVRLREVLEFVAAGVDTFAINPVGGPDIVVDGSSRFAHEREVLPIVRAARAALTPEGQQERRAKALAELAEMDADLLDLARK